MAVKLLCTECLSDNLQRDFTGRTRKDKFKCQDCGAVRLLEKMQI